MDGAREYNVKQKQKKSVRERQTPYDFICCSFKKQNKRAKGKKRKT